MLRRQSATSSSVTQGLSNSIAFEGHPSPLIQQGRLEPGASQLVSFLVSAVGFESGSSVIRHFASASSTPLEQ